MRSIFGAAGFSFRNLSFDINGFTGNVIDIQDGGASRFAVDQDGVLTANFPSGYTGTYLDLQLNGSSRFKVVNGTANVGFKLEAGGTVGFLNINNTVGAQLSFNNVFTVDSTGFKFNSTYLDSDVADILEQRRSTNAQAFRLYNTFTDASNYERGVFGWDTNELVLRAENAGTGTLRPLAINASYLEFFGNVAVLQNGFNEALKLHASYRIAWGAGAASDATGVDTGIRRDAAGVLAVSNGSTGGAALSLQEIAAPAAPAANHVRLYAQDNGAGKTQLMALFASGAAQQVAIEP